MNIKKYLILVVFFFIMISKATTVNPLLTEEGNQSNIKFSISSNKEKFDLNEQIKVALTIENVKNDPVIIYKFFIQGVTFDIMVKREKGKEIPFRGVVPDITLPEPKDFIALPSDYFLGRIIDITSDEFGYKNLDKGKYLIKCIYKSNQKNDLINGILNGRIIKESVKYDIDKYWSGKLESNTIRIQVR